MHSAIEKKSEIVWRFILRWSGVVVFLVLWEVAPRLSWVDRQFAPAFSTVLQAILELAADGSLAKHVIISLWRAACGLLAAVAIGIPLGFLLALRLPVWATVLDPFLRVLSQVNPFSLMPVFVFFFGLGETAKIVVIAWVSLWPVLFYTMTAVQHVEPVLVKTGRSFAMSDTQLYRKVILPAALPVIFVGLRIGAGLVFFMIVAAEMLGSNGGLGWLVHNSAMNYSIPRIYAGAVLIVVLGYLLNRLLRALETLLFPADQELAGLVETRPPAGFSWHPGRKSAVVVGVVIVLFLIVGGREVYTINLRAASLDGYIGRQHGAGAHTAHQHHQHQAKGTEQQHDAGAHAAHQHQHHIKGAEHE
jgi:NitT/TauT family transport system permease protein